MFIEYVVVVVSEDEFWTLTTNVLVSTEGDGITNCCSRLFELTVYWYWTLVPSYTPTSGNENIPESEVTVTSDIVTNWYDASSTTVLNAVVIWWIVRHYYWWSYLTVWFEYTKIISIHILYTNI